MSVAHQIYALIRPVGGLKIAKYLTRNHPRILMYHRLRRGEPFDGIDVDRFREQMRLIRDQFHVLSLWQLLCRNEANDVPKNAVAITFDDGYYDFYQYAYPIAQELGIPLTLFVTTGFVSGSLWLWPDKIRYALNESDKTSINLNGWNISLKDQSDKNIWWDAIATHCLSLNNDDKVQLINDLFREVDVFEPESAPREFQGMTWGQIREVSKSGVCIGSHSHSHPIMTNLNQAELTCELYISKKIIEDQTGNTPRLFCYPNGQVDDFNFEVQKEIERVGYHYAVAAYPSRTPLSDRWAINRYAASNDDVLFEKTLFGLKSLNRSNHI